MANIVYYVNWNVNDATEEEQKQWQENNNDHEDIGISDYHVAGPFETEAQAQAYIDKVQEVWDLADELNLSFEETRDAVGHHYFGLYITQEDIEIKPIEAFFEKMDKLMADMKANKQKYQTKQEDQSE